MQSGDFNRKVIIGSIQVTRNENGFENTSFVILITTWAKINGISNREFYTNNSTEMEDILNFTIRYRKNIDTTMQIQYKGNYYNILGIDDYMEQHQYLTLRARVVKQSA